MSQIPAQNPPTTEASLGPSTDVPAPAERPRFDTLPLSKDLLETLAGMGYEYPTPVQLAVFEPATRGRDVVVQARTGTGKTAAFGIPIVDQIVRRSQAQAQVLVLCPTRELALQVAREIERLGAKKNVQVVAIYGGAPMPRQVDAIAAGAQVVVGTPGRVLDHLRRKTLDPKHLRMVVLDESDEMLSMGFERELTAILEMLPKERQTLLFSATLPPDIERIARNKLHRPEFLTLSGDHVGALEIAHFVYMIAHDKLGALARVIEVENPESAVIFCNTKDETEAVSNALVQRGFDADWLNGDLPQSDREKVMSATREGRLRFLVATDVAARGIDISHLTHVINYDFPQDAEAYVHRTGRTGRAGRTGTAVSLITPHDVGGLYILRLTYKIRPIERQIPSEGELKTRAEADLVAMLAEAFLSKPVHQDDLALARRLLTHDQSDVILAGLLRDHLGARPDAAEEAAAQRRASKPRRPAPPPRVEAPASRPAPPRSEAPHAEAPRSEAPRGEARRSEAPRGEDARAESHSRPPRRDSDHRQDRPPRSDEGRRPRRERRDAPREAIGANLATERPPPPAAEEAPPPIEMRPRPQRHSDFVTWQPPEEEGDDQPILGGMPRSTAPKPVEQKPVEAQRNDESAQGGDASEIFVNVGRRDGARAADLQRLLLDRGLDRTDVLRIRVRERNAFVSVAKTAADRAIAALNGATIAGKLLAAEPARDRAGREPFDAPGSSASADEPRDPGSIPHRD